MHQTGEIVAGFRIERLLGSGGMGEVYLVRHPRLPRYDALKLLPAAASADPSYRERFQREADLAASLDHENIVTVYDRGETDGQLWIDMKYVAGQDAAAALREGGPFSARRALHIITRVASALDAAHRFGLLHRDVKPANILLGSPPGPGDPERVYLTDFGIAKGVGDAAELTPSGHFPASLDYAAPEQIQMRDLDGRCDQYALGCVLFRLLTGQVPYQGDGPYAKMNAHLTAPVPRVGLLRPGLPAAVQDVLDRALAKKPRDRFDTCGAMAAALGQALRGYEPADPSAGEQSAAPDGLPGPRPPDASETPPPHPAVAAAPATEPLRATAAENSEPEQPEPPAGGSVPPASLPWWRQVDRGAGLALFGGVTLVVLNALPPSSGQYSSSYPAELETGRFASGTLPVILLFLVAGGLQLTRWGHRWRPLISAVATGVGAFVAADSLRAYAFTGANPRGAYASVVAHTNAALPRIILGVLIVLASLAAVLRVPPRPKPRPAPDALIAMLLAAVAIVLASIAVIIGPAIQQSRLHQLAYGVPVATAVASAIVLALAVWTRRLPLLVASATVSVCAAVAGLSAPPQLHYPMGVLADGCLLAGALLLLVAARRPIRLPPPPGPSVANPYARSSAVAPSSPLAYPVRPPAAPPYGPPPHHTRSPSGPRR